MILYARRLARRLLGDQRGAAMVEFALVVPMLLILILGMIEFGEMYRRYQILTDVAREGARLSAVRMEIVNGALVTYTPAQVQTVVTSRLTDLGMTPKLVTVTNSATTNVTTVLVEYDYNMMFIGGFMGSGKSKVPLKSRARMRLE